MRAEERDPANLWDMIEAARAVVEFTEGLSLEEFLAADQKKQILRLAVERELEIIGEAARRISSSYRKAHPEIPWKAIVGLRNVISHQYDRINHTEIHRIVRNQIPDFVTLLSPLVPKPPEMDD